MNKAKQTVVEQCLALANTALASRWTFHNSTEALLWFRSVLKIEPRHPTARLGSARAYQYVASQPWWHNDVSLAKNASAKALAMVEELTERAELAVSREQALVCGQIYSAIGQPDRSERYLIEGISKDPGYSVGHYFFYFNKAFLNPADQEILPGLSKAVDMARAEGNQRRLAAALYFRGFANSLFANYADAITDLKKSMTINPGYGSANLALIAAAVLAKRSDTYKAVRSFKERYPNFNPDVLDYMWVDRSSSAAYHRLVRPMVDTVKAKLRN